MTSPGPPRKIPRGEFRGCSHLPSSPQPCRSLDMRWDPGLPKTVVPGSKLLIAAYFEVWLYQGGPGSAPRSTGCAAHTRHSGLALSSSAAGCLVPGQRSHSTSQPPMAPGQFTGPVQGCQEDIWHLLLHSAGLSKPLLASVSCSCCGFFPCTNQRQS